MSRKPISEKFRLITPINVSVNTLMLAVLSFFLMDFWSDWKEMKLNMNDVKERLSKIEGRFDDGQNFTVDDKNKICLWKINKIER